MGNTCEIFVVTPVPLVVCSAATVVSDTGGGRELMDFSSQRCRFCRAYNTNFACVGCGTPVYISSILSQLFWHRQRRRGAHRRTRASLDVPELL
ncbi:hypothetical protein CYLTODRAFT_31309 [Cylindrobasidium torrendii FP15055 ss-10]|uniref:Uncharacterized protein n=1 Tax=Cylindrobasidium torrendii FP15055 ss-10 TaxID=1314674 RepID=A0A0D7B8J8_9AGAR|nr:hypothetical protein CYLTODRAFT_31309 [Cylindrobasidium torrendii FP15055 ss-10]